MRPVVDSFFSFDRWKFVLPGESCDAPKIPIIATMSEYGYPKKYRLRKRSEYRSLSETGEACHQKHFLCIYQKGEGARSRLGITVTKKVGSAVIRNRLKRLCREFFRLNWTRLGGGWDLNIIAKHSAAKAPRQQTEKSLKNIFRVIAENRLSENSS